MEIITRGEATSSYGLMSKIRALQKFIKPSSLLTRHSMELLVVA